MKVGVITLPFSANYGWMLQVYAMQQALKQIGHEPILITRRWNYSKKSNSIAAKILRFFHYHFFCRKIYSFYDKHICSTRIYRSSEDLRNVISEYGLDAVIVGSDQVWRIENTRGAGYDFFLDFTSDSDVRRLSYAASFGNDIWAGNSEDDQKIKDLLKGFSSISVREMSGIEICKKQFWADAVCVLDPTFLLKSNDYDILLSDKAKYTDSHLLSTYILDPSADKNRFVNRIAKDLDLHIDNLFVRSRGRFRIYKSMENWLLKIRNSEFVVVDSFHGMVFCIIFKKQFLVLVNKRRGNARFINVLSKLNLNDRLVYELDQDITPLYGKIDYSKVDEILDKERNMSFDYLKKSLS